MSTPTSPDPASGIFPTTIWSQVRPGANERARALETLARRYQRPAEAYLRAALGLSADEARELFQSFFVRVLETDFLERADPERGRFRALLKVALRRFATDEHRKSAAEKRGARATSLDEELAATLSDGRVARPEEELDRAWRAELVHEALERTRAELEHDGHAQVYAVFRDYYLAPGPEVDYRALAARHGLTTTDVSNFLMRAKRAYRAALRALVLDTVRGPDDLESELAWLLEGERA